MIHAGLHARVTRQDRQADDAVADVTATGVLFAGFVKRAAGHAAHAEYGLIEIIDDGVVVRVHSDVTYFSKHDGPPSARLRLFVSDRC